MRAVLGLLLIMLGLAMAVVWMPENDGHRQLASVTEIATQGVSSGPVAARTANSTPEQHGARTFSPQTPLMARVDVGSGAPAHTAALARISSPMPLTTPSAAAGVVSATSVQEASVVSGALLSAATVAGTQTRSQAASDPGQARAAGQPALSREELIRSLQRELKRVGCYHGDVDGSWGVGSRRAMGAFTERVNASLPIDQPDFVLLALIKNHTSTACGRDCPSGQSLSDTGRCLPNAIVARANRAPERARPARGEEQVAAVDGPQAGGRWTTRVQTEMPSSSAMTPLAAAAVASAVAAPVAVTPLPGRMAMGGPRAGGGAYVTPPPAQPLARDAVAAPSAGSDDAAPQRPSANGRRSRASQAALRRQAAGSRASAVYSYRYPTPSVGVYRSTRPIAAPRYYASAPRRASRTWTATFFNNH